MPRLSLAYAKIMQIESRIIQVLLERYAEMQLSLCKDNANRVQNRPSLAWALCRDAA